MANKFLLMLMAITPIAAQAQANRQLNYLDEMAKVDAQIAYVQKQTELREALKKSSGNESLPKILSISVDDRGGLAQVVYGTGIVRWIKKGDVIQEGVQVQSIEKSAVVAAGNGSKFRLSFYTPQPNAAGAADPMPAPPRLNIPLPQAPTVAPVSAAPASAASVGSVSAAALPAVK